MNKIRVLADPDSAAIYQERAGAFPIGAIILKEEYDFADDGCMGKVKQWTVMRHDGPNAPPQGLGWSWQRVGAARNVAGLNEQRCHGCHTSCGAPPDGFEGTCALP